MSEAWEKLRMRGPLREIVRATERIQTFRYWAVLTCGHKRTFTRPFARRGDIPKRLECLYCEKTRKARDYGTPRP